MSIADKLTTIAGNVQKVYEAGKAQGGGGISEELMSTFWKAITGAGLARDYSEVFMGLNFDNTTFKPQSLIRPTIASNMFNQCSVGLEEDLQVDGIEYENTKNTMFDFSQCESAVQVFYKCDLFKSINNIDFSILSSTPRNAFAYSSIQRIEYFYPPDFNLTNVFANATKLAYIGFDVELAKSINLQSCPLENESAILLFQNLVNYAGTENEFAYTITLNDEVWARLDALGNVSPNGNTWRLYCADLGWNT